MRDELRLASDRGIGRKIENSLAASVSESEPTTVFEFSLQTCTVQAHCAAFSLASPNASMNVKTCTCALS